MRASPRSVPCSSSSWTKQFLAGRRGGGRLTAPANGRTLVPKREVCRVKSISCRMGNHNWAFRDNNDGERIRECSRCGAIENDEPPRSFDSTFIFPGDS